MELFCVDYFLHGLGVFGSWYMYMHAEAVDIMS